MNHKRVHRVYREAGLSLAAEETEALRPQWDSRCWRGPRRTRSGRWILCIDAVECGRAIRVLSVVDAYTRECLALEVDTSFASRRVTRVLEAIVAE